MRVCVWWWWWVVVVVCAAVCVCVGWWWWGEGAAGWAAAAHFPRCLTIAHRRKFISVTPGPYIGSGLVVNSEFIHCAFAIHRASAWEFHNWNMMTCSRATPVACSGGFSVRAKNGATLYEPSWVRRHTVIQLGLLHVFARQTIQTVLVDDR